MKFEQALAALREGKTMTRLGWNGKGMWIKLQKPDRHSKMTLPYLYMSTVDGSKVPWVASHTDMLAEDWINIWEEETDPDRGTGRTTRMLLRALSACGDKQDICIVGMNALHAQRLMEQFLDWADKTGVPVIYRVRGLGKANVADTECHFISLADIKMWRHGCKVNTVEFWDHAAADLHALTHSKG